jgi:type IV conjugative transfer system coupling protein TraD
MDKQNNTKSFIRGGQLFFYNALMFRQVTGRIVKWALLMYLFIFLVFMVCLTSHYDFLSLYTQCYSYILSYVGLSDVHVWTAQHRPDIYFTAHEFLTTPHLQNFVSIAVSNLISHTIMALFGSIAIYYLATKTMTRYFLKVGKKHSKDQVLSGTILTQDPKETIESVKKGRCGASNIKIANKIPLPKFSEFQGIMFHGSTGSGKSENIKRLLDEIKASGDPCIIYDKECTLKPYYFREGFDRELNPMSTLCENWDIWSECNNPIEMASIALYLMPKSVQGSDPFWVDASRTIFTAVAWKMREQEDRTIIKLLQVLLTTTLEELRTMLQKSEAENLVSKDIEKTAISIRAVIATYTKSLRFLEGLENDKNKPRFSVKQWVKSQFDSKQEKKEWLYITSQSKYHTEIKPLISAWIGMSMRAIQTLPSNSGRKFWIVIDEMASLHRLEDFSDITADIRKFGGCVVIGVQSIRQLEAIYGRDEATAITDLFNTAVYSRSPKSAVAEWVSKDLGSQSIKEVRESQSYGPNAIRDGNTLSDNRVTRPTVEVSDIMELPDLTFYLRLAGKHPITQMSIDYISDRETTIENPITIREIDWDAIQRMSDTANNIENEKGVDPSVLADKQQKEKQDKEAQENNLLNLLDQNENNINQDKEKIL